MNGYWQGHCTTCNHDVGADTEEQLKQEICARTGEVHDLTKVENILPPDADLDWENFNPVMP